MKWQNSLLWTACYAFFKICNLTCFQPAYDCLSVFSHNVSPCFLHCCLSQLSLSIFKLPLYKMCNMETFKIYRTNVKTLFCSLPHLWCTCFITWDQAINWFQFFYCCTITHWYTDFFSYCNFHNMRDMPGFHSASHIYHKLSCKTRTAPSSHWINSFWENQFPNQQIFYGKVGLYLYKQQTNISFQ